MVVYSPFMARLAALQAQRGRVPIGYTGAAPPGVGNMGAKFPFRPQSVRWPGMGGPTTTLAEALAAYQAAVGPAVGKSGAANLHLNTGAAYVNPHLNAGGAVAGPVGPRQPGEFPWRWY